jgi:hypothetical protein
VRWWESRRLTGKPHPRRGRARPPGAPSVKRPAQRSGPTRFAVPRHDARIVGALHKPGWDGFRSVPGLREKHGDAVERVPTGREVRFMVPGRDFEIVGASHEPLLRLSQPFVAGATEDCESRFKVPRRDARIVAASMNCPRWGEPWIRRCEEQVGSAGASYSLSGEVHGPNPGAAAPRAALHTRLAVQELRARNGYSQRSPSAPTPQTGG